MATTSTSHPTAPAPARREGSPRMGRGARRRLAWAAGGLALIAAIVGVLVLGPNKNPAPQHLSATPAQQPEELVKAPLAEDARRVAVRFIQTAVARENLDEAWTLVGPNLRGGLTKKRWTSGENPVVPYPVDKLDVAPYKVDASYTRSALLEVALLPRKGAGVRAQVFFLELKKLGSGPASRWVVDNWVPRAAAVVPR
ncbi:MAG TPA: hypothetical protein VFG57_07350 [Gaiella sp.]|nr:hypothetical protein [Gaiella sp.]